MEVNDIKDEKHYPLTYKEFEEKVIELTLTRFKTKDLDYIIKQIDDLLESEEGLMERLYGSACFVYENPQIYGENAKRTFEDGYIMQDAVSQIMMFLG